MKLWLDDVRTPPPGWHWVRSVNQAIVALTTAGTKVTHMSLDHDLGSFEPDGGDGIKLTYWMAEHDIWPTAGIRVHSANPVGVQNMLSTIDTYGPFPLTGGDKRGSWAGVELSRDPLTPMATSYHR